MNAVGSIVIGLYCVFPKATVWGGSFNGEWMVIAELADGSWRVYDKRAVNVTRTMDGVTLTELIEAAQTFRGLNAPLPLS